MTTLRVPLTAEAIRAGVPGSPSSCPIALAILAIPFGRGRPRTVLVGCGDVVIAVDRTARFRLDGRATRFVLAFDDGMHRSLVGRLCARLFLGVSFRPFTFEMTRI